MSEPVKPLQVVDAEGDFNTDGVQAFARSSGLEYAAQGYQVVAIMGPQSSGKSTLMNAVVSIHTVSWFCAAAPLTGLTMHHLTWTVVHGAVRHLVHGDGRHERAAADNTRHLDGAQSQAAVVPGGRRTETMCITGNYVHLTYAIVAATRHSHCLASKLQANVNACIRRPSPSPSDLV